MYNFHSQGLYLLLKDRIEEFAMGFFARIGRWQSIIFDSFNVAGHIEAFAGEKVGHIRLVHGGVVHRTGDQLDVIDTKIVRVCFDWKKSIDFDG